MSMAYCSCAYKPIRLEIWFILPSMPKNINMNTHLGTIWEQEVDFRSAKYILYLQPRHEA